MLYLICLCQRAKEPRGIVLNLNSYNNKTDVLKIAFYGILYIKCVNYHKKKQCTEHIQHTTLIKFFFH